MNDPKIGKEILCDEIIDEAKTLASCTYEENTSWGKEVSTILLLLPIYILQVREIK